MALSDCGGTARRSTWLRRPFDVRRIILLRHGRTEWNDATRFQGHQDVPLDEVGREQARAAASALAVERPDLLVCSDLARAAETAGEMSAATGLPVVSDSALREVNGGAWEGLALSRIREVDPDGFAAWVTDPDSRPGGGESLPEVGERAARALLRYLKDVPPGGTLLAVTHGGAARAAIGVLLGLPASTWRSLRVLDNCGWAVLANGAPERPWQMTAYNRGPSSGD